MKQIMIALALAASINVAYAQKSEEAVKKAVSTAEAACQDAKKGAKSATWLKAAKANLDAYKAPQGKGVLGLSREMVAEAQGSLRPTSTREETVKNIPLTVDVYPYCNYYYSSNALKIIEVTKPFVPNALDNALNAYLKAYELETKAAKKEDIKKSVQEIIDYYVEDGANYYNLANYAKSAEMFSKAAEASKTPASNKLDTMAVYNAGLAADLAGDNATAEKYYTEAISYGYNLKGDAFARLAEVKKKGNDLEGAKKILEEGFVSCPENQGILVGLINLYLDTNDDSNKIIGLLKKAQENEPNNASLYYVEGNLYKQFGNYDDAMTAYDKCTKADAKYPYGEIGKGLVFYEKAEKIREEAQNEMNDRKYEELVKQYDAALKESLTYFENGYNISSDNSLKKNLAEYLKSIYYRYRDESPENQAAYDKYAEIVKNGVN